MRWETEAGGTVIETIAGNIEWRMDILDIDVGNNESSGMYTKDVDPIKKKYFSKWHSNLGDRRWLAVEIDFYKAIIFVYDLDKDCITNDQLKDKLRAASIIVPLLLKEINIDLETNTLTIERTTKQAVSGDCGIYVAKYIECLSIKGPIEQVNGFYVNRWREKMAANIFALDYEP
ncbi:sentrin-specific protease 1-like [Olea europaea subsp. europaea]|uniref:Sentrin-specific protease 1-like n=1 Tax=Olea europaea subsp. europaea TaxID=158383 RepID=A0A8S0RMS6_OLEEU|nr:sentrin-specific protease 1-like [Olea europaea subsp. europaea]